MKVKTRKQTRKEFRKAKKLKKHEFFSKKKAKNQQGEQYLKKTPLQKWKECKADPEGKGIEKLSQKVEKTVKKEKIRKEFRNFKEKLGFEREKEKKQKEKLEREIHQQRVKRLKEDNLREDMEIRRLEKQLKMHKGKSKAFASDGLDYLIDICDKTNSKSIFEKTIKDSDSEFESDLETIVGEPGKKNGLKIQKKREKENEIEDESEETYSEQECFSEPNEENEDIKDVQFIYPDLSKTDSEKQKQSTKKTKKQKNKNNIKESLELCQQVKMQVQTEENRSESDFSAIKGVNSRGNVHAKNSQSTNTWEDIYGRTRDEKGNVMTTYTPPHLRKKARGENAGEKLARLRKQLKGLLNRLSESNMSFISNQIEQLYMSNSRNDMNETLCTLFYDSIVTEVLTPERLIAEHAMLIAVLHGNVGSEIGAHLLQYFVLEFCNLLETKNDVPDKRINNILSFILQLYNFQIFHSKLMYDLISELLKNLEEKQGVGESASVRR